MLGMIVHGVLMAQDPPPGGPGAPPPGGQGSTMYGTLVSIGAGSLVIETDAGAALTFIVDETSVLPAVMTTRDRVGVEYRVSDRGGYRATRLTVLETDRQPATTAAGAALMGREDEAAADADDRLPATAGPLPLLALAGGLSITAAVGLRLMALRRRPRD
jgi:hypothetical protein